MKFIKKVFGKINPKPILTNKDFWDWFMKNEEDFFKTIKLGKNINGNFFDKIEPKLCELREGYFYLTGMYDENTVELIITPDGNVKNIVFVEELVDSAPEIKGWKFTSLKPPLDIKNVSISMGGYEFNAENLSFYSNDNSIYPDEIDITVVHNDLTEENRNDIVNGIYIFLDNYLGEMNFVTIIDNINITGVDESNKELIPISKLKDFIIWREKEFIEKYNGERTEIEKNKHSIFESSLKNGKKLIATINTDILKWERKASHPWILVVEIKYDGESNNGFPNKTTYKKLGCMEDELLCELKDVGGYLYIGRQTADNLREVYFACKDFRKPSKVANNLQEKYKGIEEISYDIYKDKYWQTFNCFYPKN